MNESKLLKIIEKLYSEKLNEYEYNDILDQLKKNKSNVSRLVFNLIEKKNDDRAKFLLYLLGDIEAKESVNKLMNMIKDPNMTDEMKLIVSTTIQRLGGEIDFEQFLKNLKDPAELGRQVLENLLDNSENPFFIQKLLEDFHQVNRDGQIASLDDLSYHSADKRVLNIADPLSDVVDDELKLKIIEILVNSHHQRAFSILKRIIRRTKSKQVQTAAQQGIFQLGKYVSQTQATDEPAFKFYKAYMTSVDGIGSSICLFAASDKNAEIFCIDVVANTELGIKDSFGVIQSKQEFREFVNQFKLEPGFFIVEVPADILIDKVKEAEELTVKLQRALPLEYLAFRRIIDDVSYDDGPGEKLADSFQQFREKTLQHKDDLVYKTESLFNHREIQQSWLLEPEFIDPLLDDYNEALYSVSGPLSKIDIRRVRELVAKVIKQAFTEEFLKILKKRLTDFAFISFVARKNKLAELAIVASETLDNFDEDFHPFISRMVTNSFTSRLIMDLDFDEDDEYEDAEFDEEFDEEELYAELERQFGMDNDDEFEDDNPYEDHPRERFEGEELLLPESANLSGLQKLQLLAEKMPKTDFGKFFDPKITSADLETKIRHVNYLQTAFNGFVTYYTNYFDWDALRKQLNISTSRKYFTDDLLNIEKRVITSMTDYEYHKYYIDYATRLWSEAVMLSKGNLKPMKKLETWAAALEYLACAINPYRPSQQEVANYYEISVATLGNRLKVLKKLLNLKVYSYYDDQEYAFLFDKDNII